MTNRPVKPLPGMVIGRGCIGSTVYYTYACNHCANFRLTVSPEDRDMADMIALNHSLICKNTIKDGK